MDIEHLTKTQIILLTLLTSFVTSIATGIVTVSLMDQAPPAIAQTVNRVVERTVEKVVPQAQSASAVQTQTVVIKESALISQALEMVQPGIVRIFSTSADDPQYMGLGLALNGGVVVADIGGIGQAGDAVVQQSTGAKIRAFVIKRDDANGLAYLSAATTTVDGKDVVWKTATLSKAKISLGETIFAMAGKSSYRVGDGIVVALGDGDHAGTIDTNISVDSIGAGSPLIDTDGKVAGFSTSVSRSSSASAFISASSISPETKAPEKK